MVGVLVHGDRSGSRWSGSPGSRATPGRPSHPTGTPTNGGVLYLGDRVHVSVGVEPGNQAKTTKIVEKVTHIKTRRGGKGPLLQAFFNTTWEGGRGQVLQDVELFS